VKRAFFFVVPCAAALAVLAPVQVGCVDNTLVTGVTPITGVIVRSDTLVDGYGCGTGDGQLFKYYALITENLTEGGAPTTQYGVYDCFADATFANLSTDGNTFSVSIYGFSEASFAKARAACTAKAAAETPTNADAGDDAAQEAGATLAPCSDSKVGDFFYPSGAQAFATLTTSCTAVPQSSIQVLAVCAPLQRVSPKAP
jgi:hypothetical protein